MDVAFLTPRSGLVALLVLVPLLAFVRARRVGRRSRSVIGLVEPRRRSFVVPLGALLATAALLGVAATQPVVSSDVTRSVRTDAEAFVVFDVSRSMLASAAAQEPSRIARSKAAALKLREALPTVKFGAASVTDRTLPHLFPSGDADAYRATLQKAIGIERPPPVHSLLRRVTSLESLGAVATQSFFSPDARRRVLVVFTDGETLPGTRARLGPLFQRPPGISTVFVHVWGRDERVYLRRAPEIGYRADPGSREALERIAAGIGGQVVPESDLGKVTRQVSRLVGTGPTVVEGERRRDIPLAPPLAAAAFLPLALLLWRRDR
jgi:hypothetical protein